MTVCVGVISNSSEVVAVAADRMVTGGIPQVEFEHKGSKIIQLSHNCMALTAGDALAGKALFDAVCSQLGKEDHPIDYVVETVKAELRRQRNRRAEEELLLPRGITLKEFYDQWINNWPKELAVAIDNEIQTADFGLHILIAGVDERPHLYVVMSPGIAQCYDSMGFCAIGSGAPLAMLQCISTNPGPSEHLNAAIYRAHEAKLAAEPTPGVGQETDVAVVRRDQCKMLDESVVTKLRETQQNIRARNVPHVEEALGQLQLLPDEDGEVDQTCQH